MRRRSRTTRRRLWLWQSMGGALRPDMALSGDYNNGTTDRRAVRGADDPSGQHCRCCRRSRHGDADLTAEARLSRGRLLDAASMQPPAHNRDDRDGAANTHQAASPHRPIIPAPAVSRSQAIEARKNHCALAKSAHICGHRAPRSTQRSGRASNSGRNLTAKPWPSRSRNLGDG